MRSEEELKEIYINNHHRIVEMFFKELLSVAKEGLSQQDIYDKANLLQQKIRKEIDLTEVKDDEREYIASHIKEWELDKDFNHDLMRHIFKKLIDNKEKILDKKV